MKDEAKRWIIKVGLRQYCVDRAGNGWPAVYIGVENGKVRHISEGIKAPGMDLAIGEGDIIILASAVSEYELSDRQRWVLQKLIDNGQERLAAKVERTWMYGLYYKPGAALFVESHRLENFFVITCGGLYEQAILANEFARFRRHMLPSALEAENQSWQKEHSG